MKKHILLSIISLPLFLFSSHTFAQSKGERYYGFINQAKAQIIKGNADSALIIYKKTIQRFNFPFITNMKQGAYLSSLCHNKKDFSFFLSHSVRNGLTKNEYEDLVKHWNSNNKNQKFTPKIFDSIHGIYLNKLDPDKIFCFIYLDVQRNHLIKSLMQKKISKKEYFDSMFKLRNKYIADVQKYGYPTERKSGYYFKIHTFNSSIDVNKNYLFKHIYTLGKEKKDTLIITLSESKFGKILTYKPSYWFLSHYINPTHHKKVDTALFRVLNKGFSKLRIDPIIIIMAYESTHVPKNEFAISYYSQLFAYQLNFNYYKKFNLPKKTKQIINKNRTKYYIPTIQMEQKLIKSLYQLKYNKPISVRKLKKMNKKGTADIKCFINYM